MDAKTSIWAKWSKVRVHAMWLAVAVAGCWASAFFGQVRALATCVEMAAKMATEIQPHSVAIGVKQGQTEFARLIWTATQAETIPDPAEGVLTAVTDEIGVSGTCTATTVWQRGPAGHVNIWCPDEKEGLLLGVVWVGSDCKPKLCRENFAAQGGEGEFCSLQCLGEWLLADAKKADKPPAVDAKARSVGRKAVQDLKRRWNRLRGK